MILITRNSHSVYLTARFLFLGLSVYEAMLLSGALSRCESDCPSVQTDSTLTARCRHMQGMQPTVANVFHGSADHAVAGLQLRSSVFHDSNATHATNVQCLSLSPLPALALWRFPCGTVRHIILLSVFFPQLIRTQPPYLSEP